MLSDFVDFGCLLITALWMLLLAFWPAAVGGAALSLLLAFGLAAKQGRRGIAATCGSAFMVVALGLCALCWLPDAFLLDWLPMSARPFAQLLVVPAPLVAMFLAVTAMQVLLAEPRRAR